MFFGIRNKRTALGRFTSEKCTVCKDGTEYAFIKKTKYLVAFFINLIPLKTTYESVCKQCGDVSDVKTRVGKEIAQKEFASEYTKRNLIDIAKVAAAVIVVAAAVLLPILLVHVPATSPETLKSLVSEDGVYNILQEDGTVLGTVDITDGEKTLTFYDRIRVLTGEPGADGSFLLHEYFYEKTNTETGETALVRLADDPGVLQDRYSRDVRTYHYDVAADALGYARGVVDLSTIEYSADKVIYPFVFYLDSGEAKDYTEVLYLMPDQQLHVTFIGAASDNDLIQAIAIEVADMDGDRAMKRDIYQFDTTTIGLAQANGLSPASTAEDFLTFILDNALTPIQSMTYQYYGDTNVITQNTYSQPDDTGVMQTVTQDYIITEKDGYYIMQAAE